MKYEDAVGLLSKAAPYEIAVSVSQKVSSMNRLPINLRLIPLEKGIDTFCHLSVVFMLLHIVGSNRDRFSLFCSKCYLANLLYCDA